MSPGAVGIAGGLLAALLAASCSSDGQAPPTTATFLPAARMPGTGQVFLSLEAGAGQQLDLAVRVRETSGIAEADLRLSYDPRRVVFRGSADGALLEQGGGAVAYSVFEQVPGFLRIVARRTDPGAASAGSDDPVLVRLAFVVVAAGQAEATFQPLSVLADENGSALEGIAFFAGTFVGG